MTDKNDQVIPFPQDIRVIKLRPLADILEERRRQRQARLEQLPVWQKRHGNRTPRT